MNSGRLRDLLKLVASIAVSLSAGAIGSVFTAPAISTWYTTLTKPSFTPPGWLFGPAWTTLYVLMGLSAFLVWRKGTGRPDVRQALTFFLAQLVLNALWSVAFFGLHSPLYGLIVILALWVVLFCTLTRFFRLSRAAGWLLVPYLAWVSFAAVLNFSIWKLNP